MFPDLPTCDLLKLDVEGRELECLRGAKKLLTRCRNILVEAGDSNSTRFGYVSGDLLRLLQEHDFSVYTINGSRITPVDDDSGTDQVEDWIATKEPDKLRKKLNRSAINEPASRCST